MRTRNAENPKPAAAKKTPPARKSAAKAPPNPPDSSAEASTPKSAEAKRSASAKSNQSKTNETTPSATTESKPELAAEEETKGSIDASPSTPVAELVSGTKTAKTAVRKTSARTKTPSAKAAASKQTPKSGETGKVKLEEPVNEEEEEEVGNAEELEPVKLEPSTVVVEDQIAREEAPTDVCVSASIKMEDNSGPGLEEPSSKEEKANEAQKDSTLNQNVGELSKQGEAPVEHVAGSSEDQQSSLAKEGVEVTEEMEEMKNEDDGNSKNKQVIAEGITSEEFGREGAQKLDDSECRDEEKVDFGDQEYIEEFVDEELADGDGTEHGEQSMALEEEHVELAAAAKEHKLKKELEIFVGGLDRDAVEEDVKKAFESIGDVVEVRLHKDISTNKNKGYAFVEFATKEQASRALSEMKNPLIRGKRCGTAPSEDNSTLFLGNICNTWTKEAIKQKLKDYGVGGVENVTLVPDAQHEGLSRGFAFVEFSCHDDAMLAYKRLQKPDAIFGHPERTAKVAFAEPLREPDPEVMAQVKSVFIDGLPAHWDEDRVREQFKSYGQIERIVLARNMSTAKRKDFGFVDFTTHEVAVACIDGVNSNGLSDGNSKIKVRARLSNPLPKTQPVKGGMCGGFRIGHGGAGSSSRFGRGFGRATHFSNRSNFQRGRGFYQHGRGRGGRTGFANEHDLNSHYPPFNGRQNFGRGGRRGFLGPSPARPDIDRPWYGASNRGPGRHLPAMQQPFPPEEGFNRPFLGRHFDDPYFCDDSGHGMKRPFYMTDQDRDYLEPSRQRPRFDDSDPALSFRGSRYRDTFGSAVGSYSHDYYGPDYGEGAYSSFYGGDRPYGGGYYY